MRERDKKNTRNRTPDNEIEVISFNLEPEHVRKQNTAHKSRRREEQEKETRNREFARVTYLFVTIFLAMMGYLVYFNVVKSKDIINSPYNVRLDSMADRVVRGKILDNEGNVLAKTEVQEDGTETRRYPYGNMFAHVVGYDSKGKSGLESISNFDLLTSNANFMEQFVHELKEEKNIGDNVITTLDMTLQEAAYHALGDYKGAVVVTEVTTGKILAMVSKPDYNPNTISEDWDEILNSSGSMLLNRVTQGAYAPGSVFKLVTALEYMRENKAYNSYHYTCEGEIEYEGTIIHCAKNRKHGEEDLATSLANSCNTSFSNIGLNLNVAGMQKTAKGLLFNTKLPSLFPYSKSKFQLDKEDASSEVMMTAIGQGETLVSPYHMVLIASAIGNGGILMEPYLVDRIESHTGASVEKNMPKKYTELMTSQEASILKDYMIKVVENGTASALKSEKYIVAGKTGTAEYSSDKEKAHSWFMGFTNPDNPDLAISIVVESADNSGMSAVSVAKKILNAYY